MQKVLIQLEVPMALDPSDVADQVAAVLIDTLGARVVTVKVSTEHETVVIS